jgi:hypothetical protein
VSNGQICIWARMCKWCQVFSLGGLHHLTRLYHINSWSNPRTYMVILSGIVRLGGPRDCPKSGLPSLHLLNTGFFYHQFELRPENQLYSSRNNRKSFSQVATGAAFIFFCEHPISSFWSKTGLNPGKSSYSEPFFCTTYSTYCLASHGPGCTGAKSLHSFLGSRLQLSSKSP